MNIFVLDRDIELCASYHCDKHVVKMITEHAQMLSTVCRLNGFDKGYKVTHQNHPCTKWVGESLSNYRWLILLTNALHDEWRKRYNHSSTKFHKAQEVVLGLPWSPISDIGLTPFAQAMPEQYKNADAVVAYRNYYKGEKQHILSYTGTKRASQRAKMPYWLKDIEWGF